MLYVKQNWEQIGFKIRSFQENEKFTDIELVVDNQVFVGHKVVLASASPYFETMFSTELSEKGKSTIELHGLKKEIFQILFDYIYKHRFELNENNVLEILDGANLLQLTGLISSCCKFLRQKLNDKNVIGIYRLTDLYSSTEKLLNLKRKCKFFIEQHFQSVIECNEFLDLPFHLLEILLKSESLNVHNELDVFKVVLKWLQISADQRLNYTHQLIKHVRLPTIPEDKKNGLIEKVTHVELKRILKMIVQQDLLKNSISTNTTHNQTTPLTTSQVTNCENAIDEKFKSLLHLNIRWKPRIKCCQMFYLIGGRHKNELSSNIVRIESSTFKLTRLKSLQVARYNHQSVALDGRLYIAGGVNSTNIHLKLVEVFDYYENEKVNSSYMLNSRQNFGLVSYDGYLLAIGGSSEEPSSIERYDPKTNQWSIFDSIAELPISGFRVQRVRDLIYIIGGVNKFNQKLNQTLCYDPRTRRIKQLSRMQECRASFGCAFAFGYIYVIGGDSVTNPNYGYTAERYSINDDEWTFINGLERPVINFCVLVAFNNLCLIGGEHPFGLDLSNAISCYDPEHNKWTTSEKNLPFRTSCASLTTID